ncbi:MAG: SLC13 family permease [Candidatus Fimivivens sp.]|nr:SLC13 family permease [Candidatus Fimivivens sp.]
MLLNPVIVAVVLLCVLCLMKMNILLAMIISLFAGGVVGGLGIGGTMSSLLAGLGSNGETALAYILLGTFATAMATTGIVDILGQKMTKFIGDKKMVFLWVLAFIACLSQNAIPVHIAFIPILIPPLLILMNKLKIDRRAAACSLAFGLKAPYITLPVGFGLIFHGIVAKNMTTNGMPVDVKEVWKANWILGLSMFVGLCIALFITYRKPRDYKDIQIIEHEIPEELKFESRHWFTLAAIIIMVVLQIQFGSLPIAALGGLLILIVTGTIKWNQIDAQFDGGIKLMGFIAFVMLVAGGFAQVLKDTGAVDELVKGSIGLMGGNKLIAATMITLIGLLVTMGIGTSFGTIPVLAVLYVPLCQQMGFSTQATILLISAAAALGDAGSPASDTTLGPTSGLNADGQHDHIWDTCVPTFLHYNIPLMIAAIIGSQFM